MTRHVSVILIAGADSDGSLNLAPGTARAVQSIEDDIRKRFEGRIRQIDRLNAPTYSEVVDSFARQRSSIAADDLFVVMFAGHGAKPDEPTSGQQWYLRPDQVFDDNALADQLLALRPGVDSVVISDCCYGEGAFSRDAYLKLETVMDALHETAARHGSIDDLRRVVEDQQLAAQVPLLGHRLHERFIAAKRDSPMICISAAGTDALVDEQWLPDLADYTVRAAQEGKRYSDLDAQFKKVAAGHRTFHVDARPDKRINDRVLGA